MTQPRIFSVMEISPRYPFFRSKTVPKKWKVERHSNCLQYKFVREEEQCEHTTNTSQNAPKVRPVVVQPLAAKKRTHVDNMQTRRQTAPQALQSTTNEDIDSSMEPKGRHSQPVGLSLLRSCEAQARKEAESRRSLPIEPSLLLKSCPPSAFSRPLYGIHPPTGPRSDKIASASNRMERSHGKRKYHKDHRIQKSRTPSSRRKYHEIRSEEHPAAGIHVRNGPSIAQTLVATEYHSIPKMVTRRSRSRRSPKSLVNEPQAKGPKSETPKSLLNVPRFSEPNRTPIGPRMSHQRHSSVQQTSFKLPKLDQLSTPNALPTPEASSPVQKPNNRIFEPEEKSEGIKLTSHLPGGVVSVIPDDAAVDVEMENLEFYSADEPMTSPSLPSTPMSHSTYERSHYSGSTGMSPMSETTFFQSKGVPLPERIVWRKNQRPLRESSDSEDFHEHTLINSVEDMISDVYDGPHTPVFTKPRRVPIIMSTKSEDVSLQPVPRKASSIVGVERRSRSFEEFDVDQIVGERIAQGGLHSYLLKWVGYPGREWVTAKDCSCPDRIKEFRARQMVEFHAAARKGANHDAIYKLQQLAEAGLDSEIDTFKLPNISGWPCKRRNPSNGRFQAPGNGNSVVEITRLETAPPRNIRENTAIPPSGRPSGVVAANHLEAEEDQVIWIRTDIVLNPESWPAGRAVQPKKEPSPSSHSEGEVGFHDNGRMEDPRTEGEKGSGKAQQAVQRQRLRYAELERRCFEETTLAAETAEEEMRTRIANEEVELLRVTTEIARKKQVLEDMKRKNKALKSQRRERQIQDRVKHAIKRRVAQQKELEASVHRSCTKTTLTLSVGENTGPDRPAAVSAASFKIPTHENLIIRNAGLTMESQQLPKKVQGLQKPLSNSPARRNTARRPKASQVTKSQGNRSATSQRMSVVRRKLEDAFETDKGRKAAELYFPIRSEFRKDMGLKQVEDLIGNIRK